MSRYPRDPEQAQASEQILLGDFILHRPLWGGWEIRHIDPESEDLIAIMEDLDLSNTLLPGTTTSEEGGRRSTIDLCPVTVGLVSRAAKFNPAVPPPAMMKSKLPAS